MSCCDSIICGYLLWECSKWSGWKERMIYDSVCFNVFFLNSFDVIDTSSTEFACNDWSPLSKQHFDSFQFAGGVFFSDKIFLDLPGYTSSVASSSQWESGSLNTSCPNFLAISSIIFRAWISLYCLANVHNSARSAFGGKRIPLSFSQLDNSFFFHVDKR